MQQYLHEIPFCYNIDHLRISNFISFSETKLGAEKLKSDGMAIEQSQLQNVTSNR